MTFIRSYTKNTVSNGRVYIKNVIDLKCDECGTEFRCPDKTKNRVSGSKLHFCSKTCSVKSMSDGKLIRSIHSSIVEKYDGYYVETNKFKKEQKELCLSLYGVKSRLEAEPILEKIKASCLERFGRPTFTGSKQHVESCDFKAIAEKAWKTKISNGSCSKSKCEERLYVMLVDLFGNCVRRQIRLLNQWVDFYIESIDCYVQLDGVYWHGLNRPLDEIKLCKTSQDKKIYGQILRDRELNKYCEDNNIKLFRITDVDVNTKTQGEIYASLRTSVL